MYSTTRVGTRFDRATIDAVWAKATPVHGFNPRLRRRDACGANIEYVKYGDTTPNGYGWEIDHIYPASQGGSDDLSNLQPLQWQNNRRKGDTVGYWLCAVRATPLPF